MEKNRDIYKRQIEDSLKNYKESYRSYIYNRCKAFKRICVFGVGNLGRRPKLILDEMGLSLSLYCDNNPAKVGRDDPYGYGIPCISVNELAQYKDDTLVLIPTRYYKEIYCQLKELGFENIERLLYAKLQYHEFLDTHDRTEFAKKLKSAIDLLEDEESCRIFAGLVSEWVKNEYINGAYDNYFSAPQYFPKDILKPRRDEVFVDCGAYIGDIIDDFMEFEEDGFGTYYGFELTSEFYNLLKNNVQSRNTAQGQFVVENKGVSDCSQQFRYTLFGEGSRLDDKGEEIAEVVAIDDYFDGKKVTFIKMDVEGAELAALKGAKNTIIKWHPKLAICIYHKPDDFWRIPELIKQWVPDYHLFVRHHTDLTNETVCYAAVKEDLV